LATLKVEQERAPSNCPACFFDAQVEPFVMCDCDQHLDFTLMDAGELVM